MRTVPNSLEAELLRLPARDRARIAELLLASLDEEAESDVDEAWAAEAERRLAELRAGTVTGVPAADVHARVETRLDATDRRTG
jgi:putative addiction module component (TIGR02574 family)